MLAPVCRVDHTLVGNPGVDVNVMPGLKQLPLTVIVGETGSVTWMGNMANPAQLLTLTLARLVALPCHNICIDPVPWPPVIVPRLLGFPKLSTMDHT